MDEIKLEFLNPAHLADIVALQKLVVQHLTRKDMYYQNYETIEKRLKVAQAVVGAYCDDKLVGFHVMDTPDLSGDILAAELGWSPAELRKVVRLGPIAVHPDYRGRNIITRMVAVHLDLIRETDYRHVIATVSPYNYPSIKYLFSQGFRLEQITFRYHGNMTRCITHLDLGKPKTEELCRIKVAHDDLRTQKYLLARNFYGYGLIKTAEGYDILYGCQKDDCMEPWQERQL